MNVDISYINWGLALKTAWNGLILKIMKLLKSILCSPTASLYSVPHMNSSQEASQLITACNTCNIEIPYA